MFSSAKMRMMFELINSNGDRLAASLGKKLAESNEQDLKSWTQRFTADNIGSVAFGYECNCELEKILFFLRAIFEDFFFSRTAIDDPESMLLKSGQRMFGFTRKDIARLIFANSFPNVARKLGFRLIIKEAGDYLLKIFLESYNYREKNVIQRNDLLSMLMKLKGQLTPTEMAAESTVMFLAGFETSSTLTQFALYELAMNPDIQERLREELSSAVEENGGTLTYDILQESKYLEMVTNETLRKFPPIPKFSRYSATNYKIEDTDLVIPEGTMIEINAISLHHDPEYFPDPEKFDPERFNEENIKNIQPYTFLPFGGGPRQCLGMRFGQMQSKLGIAKIILNFSISPTERTPLKMKFSPTAIFLTPNGGLWLKLEKL
jgi:cytochrome P450 family 6